MRAGGLERARPGAARERRRHASTSPLVAARSVARCTPPGCRCTPDRSARFARARVALARPGDRDALYWTARAVFVAAREQIAAFDARVRGGLRRRRATRPSAWRPGARRRRGRRASAAPPARHARPAAAGGEPPHAPRAAAPRRGRDRVPVARRPATTSAWPTRASRLSTPTSSRALRRLMRGWRSPRRRAGAPRARRGAPRRAPRRARDAARAACAPAAIRSAVRRRRRARPRRLVVLLDVSGSMEPYARAYLLFPRARSRGARAEAFVFSTRLTRAHPARCAAAPEPRSPAPSPRRPTGRAARGSARRCTRSTTAGPARHGARRGRGDRVRRLGARRPGAPRPRDGAAARGSPTGSCG